MGTICERNQRYERHAMVDVHLTATDRYIFGEFPARMHKSTKSQRIIRQVGVQAFRDSSKASIQPG